MCFFGAFRYVICGHTDFQVVIFCKGYMNAAATANAAIEPGEPCMPRQPDPQSGDVGNIVQYNVVFPDQSRPPLQQQDIDIPAGNPCPSSGLCANCVAAAHVAQVDEEQPNFGLNDEFIPDAERMNEYFQYFIGNGNGNDNENNNADNFGAEQLPPIQNQAEHTNANANADAMLMEPDTMDMNTNVGMNAMNAAMAMPVDPRILNSNVDAMNATLPNMHPASMIGMPGQNWYQTGAAMNLQQQPPSLYSNMRTSYTHNGFPSSSTNGYQTTTNNNGYGNDNGVGNGNGNDNDNYDNAVFGQTRPRGRIVRNLGMPEDPFVAGNSNNDGQQAAIPPLFQSAGSSNNAHAGERKVRFTVPEGDDRSNLPAYTPSRYRPSRFEAQALRLKKSVRRSAIAATTAATAARNNRNRAAQQPPQLAPAPAPSTTETEAAAAETRPRQRAGAMQRLSERWQSALRSRPSASSTSNAAVKTEEADKDEGEDGCSKEGDER